MCLWAMIFQGFLASILNLRPIHQPFQCNWDTNPCHWSYLRPTMSMKKPHYIGIFLEEALLSGQPVHHPDTRIYHKEHHFIPIRRSLMLASTNCQRAPLGSFFHFILLLLFLMVQISFLLQRISLCHWVWEISQASQPKATSVVSLCWIRHHPLFSGFPKKDTHVPASAAMPGKISLPHFLTRPWGSLVMLQKQIRWKESRSRDRCAAKGDMRMKKDGLWSPLILGTLIKLMQPKHSHDENGLKCRSNDEVSLW